MGSLFDLPDPLNQKTNALADALLGYQTKPPATVPQGASLNALARAILGYQPASLINGLQSNSLGGLGSLLNGPMPVKKRKVFFSFQFDDLMRVNDVRNAWKIRHPDATLMRSFYDSSLWQNRKLEADSSVKNVIRVGVQYTSAVCVLVGSGTWDRQWVRYEIARAVIDGRGLLAVHLNSINHHVRRSPDALGPNPLDYMAVGKVHLNALAAPQYYLFEWKWQENQWGWFRYQDYKESVKLPPYLIDPSPGRVTPLSSGTMICDYVWGEGHKNLGAWIDQAAQKVGR